MTTDEGCVKVNNLGGKNGPIYVCPVFEKISRRPFCLGLLNVYAIVPYTSTTTCWRFTLVVQASLAPHLPEHRSRAITMPPTLPLVVTALCVFLFSSFCSTTANHDTSPRPERLFGYGKDYSTCPYEFIKSCFAVSIRLFGSHLCR